MKRSVPKEADVENVHVNGRQYKLTLVAAVSHGSCCASQHDVVSTSSPPSADEVNTHGLY